MYRTRRELVLHGVAVVLLSAYPLSLMLRENLGVIPIGAGTALWVLAANLVVAGLLFVALRVVTSDLAGRAAWLCVFLLIFGAYNIAMQAALAAGWQVVPEDPRVAIGYALLSVGLATVIVRPWRTRKRDPVPMIIVGLVLVGANVFAGISRAANFSSTGGRNGWQPAAAELIAATTSRGARVTSPPERDIFYIVLDGFGRLDTTARLYDLDLSQFAAFLRSRSFHIPERARTNYGQTYLSLASALNLEYLDTVAAAAGRNNSDRSPLAYLIDRNALMALAKQAGYHVVGIGSDYIATEWIHAADECKCQQYGSSMTEQAVLVTTPLVGVSLGARAFEAHRRKVLTSFEEVGRSAVPGRRSFVFAHIIAPHPPFVFERDGTSPPSSGLFVFQDGSKFPGAREDYRRGYRHQAEFVARQVMSLVDVLLSRAGPPPVIILHGDHGPGSMLDWNSADRTNMDERMDIFAAYLLPGARRQPYDTMTPVNGARLLANGYFGTDFPLLDDKTFYSTWDRPYDFLPVPAAPVDGVRPQEPGP